MIRRPLRRLLHVLIWFVALAPPAVAVGYLLYANLLNPQVVQQLTGSYDGLYWDAAQLQIAYGRFENRLLMYAAGVDRDLGKVRLRYDVLLSKLNVMRGTTRELGAMPALMQRQQDDLADLEATLAPFDARIAALPAEPSAALAMLQALREHWPEVNELALNRRNADVAGREDIRRDFIAKRRELLAAGLALLVLSAAAAVLLVMNGYRRTRLIRQQHKLLAAEHRASRAAREAGMAKDAFLGMISHELRTPLHAIVSSIELLGLRSRAEAERNVIQRLETAARQLEAQMKDLTDYARLGAGKLELRHERFDPGELLQSIVDENGEAARTRGLAFRHAWRGERRLVEADPHRIRQIANNLVTNAIRYTVRGGVSVEFGLAGATLSIVVSDTGPGVPEAQIPLIFREFTQLDASRSRRYEGAGMGLAIVRALVELFGGAIRTDSRVGEGTTFTVTIPVALVDGPVDAHAGPAADEACARPQVLVVDDNPLVRESLCEMVAHMGYTAHAAGDADGALALVDVLPCDVVLLDLHMPGRDGYTFVAGLDARAARRAALAPGRDQDRDGAAPRRPRVIAVSAYAPEPVAQGEAGPFFDSLCKPIHYGVLQTALRRALSRD